MKTTLVLCFGLLVGSAAFAAETVPTFNAMLTTGQQTRFVLLGTDGKASQWLTVGDSFDGYTLKSFDAKSGTLNLEKDGTVTPVVIGSEKTSAAAAAPVSTPATIADATATLNAMHFDTMMDKTLAAVKQQQLAAIRQMVGRMGAQGVNREDLIAFQQKVMDKMMSAVTGADLKSDVAKLYSETFTKDQLQGLANFYSSPLGEVMVQKQPELAAKINALMIPRMMKVMPEVRQMAQQFQAEQMAKQQAAMAPASGPASPAPAPAANGGTNQ